MLPVMSDPQLKNDMSNPLYTEDPHAARIRWLGAALVTAVVWALWAMPALGLIEVLGFEKALQHPRTWLMGGALALGITATLGWLRPSTADAAQAQR